MPPSWIAEPTGSQVMSASCSAPIGDPEQARDQVGHPAAARALDHPAEHVGVGRAVGEVAAVRAGGAERGHVVVHADRVALAATAASPSSAPSPGPRSRARGRSRGTPRPVRMSSRWRTVAPSYPDCPRPRARRSRSGPRGRAHPARRGSRPRSRRPTWSPTSAGAGSWASSGRRSAPRRARRRGGPGRRRSRCRRRPAPAVATDRSSRVTGVSPTDGSSAVGQRARHGAGSDQLRRDDLAHVLEGPPHVGRSPARWPG